MSRQTETYGQRASVQPGASDSLSPRLGSIWCREVRRAGRAAGRERQHRRLALYCPASPAAAATGGTGTAAAEPDSDAEYLERKKKKKKKASPKKKEDGQQAQAESNKRAEKDTGVAGGRAPHGPPRVEAASLAGAPPRPALNEQTAARPVGSTRDPAPCTASVDAPGHWWRRRVRHYARPRAARSGAGRNGARDDGAGPRVRHIAHSGRNQAGVNCLEFN